MGISRVYGRTSAVEKVMVDVFAFAAPIHARAKVDGAWLELAAYCPYMSHIEAEKCQMLVICRNSPGLPGLLSLELDLIGAPRTNRMAKLRVLSVGRCIVFSG